MNIVGIIQARTNSKRLPCKVLLDIQGKTMLERVVSRVEKATTLSNVVVATTYKRGDDDIEMLCKERQWGCFRGSEDNVLFRYCVASMKYEADIVVRITADCPLIDAGIIDEVVGKFISDYPDVDYGSNVMPRTYPRGLDVEVVDVVSLFAIARKKHINQMDREHVTLYIRQHPEEFKIFNVSNKMDYSWMRWTVDDNKDLEFARKVYGYFGDKIFGWQDVLGLLEENPKWVIGDISLRLEKV